MKKIIFFVGPPGCGKGTQARKMATKFNYLHVSTGDLIRSIAIDPTATPEEQQVLKEANLKGQLAPDWFICGLVFKTVEKFLKSRDHKGIIFDGAVRTLQQAERIQQYLSTKDLEQDAMVLAIMISDQESYDRLTKRRVCSECREIIPWLPATKDITACPKCGGALKYRPDDEPETIKKRIAEQGASALMEILDYYTRIKIVKIVNGAQSIEDVSAEVEKAISE
jgi:adenylate kinase